MRLDNRTTYCSKQLTKLIECVYEQLREYVGAPLPGWSRLRVRVMAVNVTHNALGMREQDCVLLFVSPPANMLEFITAQLLGKGTNLYPYEPTDRVAERLRDQLALCYSTEILNERLGTMHVHVDVRVPPELGPHLQPKKRKKR